MRRAPTWSAVIRLATLAAALCLPDAARAQQASTSLAVRPDTAVSDGARPGDVLRVWIWREDEMTGEYPIAMNGLVTLPLLGDVVAVGRPADSLTAEIRASYARYLRNPSITVTLLRRIAVQGWVGTPGLYPVDPTVTVAEVLAVAGGVSTDGDDENIRVLRDGRIIQAKLAAETILRSTPVRSGDVIFVPQKPWIERNSSIFVWGAVSVVTAVLIATLVSN